MSEKETGHTISASPFWKIVMTVLLCLCGVVMVLGGTLLYAARELDLVGNTKDSASGFQKVVTDTGIQVLQQYLNNPEETAYYYENWSNYDYSITTYNRETKERNTLASVYSGASAMADSYFVYIVDQGNGLEPALYDSFLENDKWYDEDVQIYEVALTVRAFMTRYIDSLSNAITVSYYYDQYSRLLPGTLIGAGVLFLMSLIFVLYAAGHTRREPGITLYWLDWVPAELVCFAGIAGTWMVLSLINLIPYSGEIGAAMLGGIVFTAELVLLTAGLSVVRRLKAGTLIQSLGITWIFHKLKDLYHILPKTPLLLAGLIAWVLVQLIALVVVFDVLSWFFGMIMFALDLILFFGIVYGLYSGRVLLKAGSELKSGNLDCRITEDEMKLMYGPLKEHAQDLNSIQEGITAAVDEKMKSERMKTELITNVSHDIKTPLTSIVNYVDLLQKEHTEEEGKEYLAVLEKNSTRLKRLTEDLVEASKASSGNVNVELSSVNVKELLEQASAEYEEKLAAGNLTLVMNCDEVYAKADGRLLWRVISNLLSNCVKYALSGTRVYIDAHENTEGKIDISVKNVSKDALNISAEELMERFVRGDSSRSTEGSGLGLNIARSLTELQNGELHLTIDGDLFKADVVLDKAEETESEAE